MKLKDIVKGMRGYEPKQGKWLRNTHLKNSWRGDKHVMALSWVINGSLRREMEAVSRLSGASGSKQGTIVFVR